MAAGRGMTTPDRNPLIGNAAGIVCMLLWAANFPLAVSVLKHWDPLAFAPVRLMLAGLTVLVFTALMGQLGAARQLLAERRFVFASLVFGISALLFISAQARVDAVSAAVVVSSMPIWSALLGWLDGSEKPGLRLLVALVLTVAGGVLTSLVSAQGSGSEGSWTGIGLMLAAVIFYVWYSRDMVLRYAHCPDIAKTSASMLLASLPAFAVLAGAFALGHDLRADFSTPVLVEIVLLVCVAIAGSAVLWLWTGRMIGVTVAAMHHNMVPFYVIVLAALGGAVVTGQHVLGALLVVAGAAIAQLRPRERKAGVTQPVPAGRKTRDEPLR
jgi:drug/metabolite transporter (DMT)-like permease